MPEDGKTLRFEVEPETEIESQCTLIGFLGVDVEL
jgi:hypothetical protein